MTAFLELLKTYAIFWYMAGVIAVLFGIKMLFDARRAARTTLFTLEQEQASDRAFRAVVVMLAATLFIGAVAGINAFVTPAVPTPEADQISPTAPPFTPPVILPSATPQPTQTLPPPTAAPTVQPTKASVAPTSASTQPTPEPPPTAPSEPPTPAPTATSNLIYPRPPLNTPPDGDSIGSNNIRFSWGYNQEADAYDVPQTLPPDQFYRVVVMYTSVSQNKAQSIVVCLHETSMDRRTGLDLTDYRSDAVGGDFKWNVVIVRAASQQACEAGEMSAQSPPSQTFSFKLP